MTFGLVDWIESHSALELEGIVVMLIVTLDPQRSKERLRLGNACGV